MKKLIGPALSLALVASASADPQPSRMEITRAGSQPAKKGPAENFTGVAMITPLFPANEQLHASAGSVTFAPGARSRWHTHPAGQLLIVTAGVGWIQEWGGKKQELRPGDVIWTPPGVKHWHGATAASPMTHTAVQAAVAGKAVEWLEPVTDEQYH